MTGSLSNTLRIVDPEYEAGPESKKNLSIGLLPGGFVFSVIDLERYRYTALEEYVQPVDDAPYSYLDALPALCRGHRLLKGGFEKISLSYYTPELILLPLDLFNTSDSGMLPDLLGQAGHKTLIRHDILNILGASGVYLADREAIRVCDSLFPNYRLRHHGSVLIENILASQKLDNWRADLVIHLHDRYFELVLLKKQQLILYRSYHVRSFEDLLYYVFHVLQELNLRPSGLTCMLTGKIAMDTLEYESLKAYFRQTGFPEKNDMYTYPPAFDQVPYHYYFNLLNLDTCG